jgi:hypothetical protein
MKKSDESVNYLNNKREIFVKLLDSIDLANKNKKTKIYVKKNKILDEEISVIAKQEEWPTIFQKAMTFFKSLEDYEMCQKCKNIQESVSTNQKKKIDPYVENY